MPALTEAHARDIARDALLIAEDDYPRLDTLAECVTILIEQALTVVRIPCPRDVVLCTRHQTIAMLVRAGAMQQTQAEPGAADQRGLGVFGFGQP